MKPKLNYTKPSITELEVGYATDAARNGWGDACYAYIERFEQLFRDHVGTRYAISTSSCTGALHMGLAALGIGPGDEVILADTNWIASVAPVTYLGATPVFVDIHPGSWCIDPALAEKAISAKTKAIIATHLYGNLCDMESLLALGKRHGIPIVEDAAEAIGSRWQTRRAGSMGTFGTFSFHGTKTLTTGEGGMFVTDEKALFEKVLALSNHGRVPGGRQFRPEYIGYKYKISNIQAAIGCAQLERIEELVQRKRDILGFYRQALQGYPEIAMNPEPDGVVNGAWMPTVVFAAATGVTRTRLQEAFAAENIDARVFFYPLTSLPPFQTCPENRHAWDIPERAINLPSFHDMTEADQVRVVRVLQSVIDEASQ